MCTKIRKRGFTLIELLVVIDTNHTDATFDPQNHILASAMPLV